MKNLQAELKKALEQKSGAQKAQQHLEQLNQRLHAEYKRNTELANRLEKEDRDYEKLQTLSLKGLFYTILGNKQKQMEREKQEYLEASLQFDECRKAVDLMEFEKKVLEEKLQKLAGIDGKVKKLLKEREQVLIREGGPQGRKLIGIAQEIEAKEQELFEIQEAIDIGKDTAEVLEEMIGYLRKARNWGNWDLMGGKELSTIIKHSNIDKARNMAHKARFLLLKFEDELRDIYRDVNEIGFSLNMDSFVRFADVFFDNLISDWIVQQRISNAVNVVNSVFDRVRRQLATLEARQHSVKGKVAKLKRERRRLAVQ